MAEFSSEILKTKSSGQYVESAGKARHLLKNPRSGKTDLQNRERNTLPDRQKVRDHVTISPALQKC